LDDYIRLKRVFILCTSLNSSNSEDGHYFKLYLSIVKVTWKTLMDCSFLAVLPGRTWLTTEWGLGRSSWGRGEGLWQAECRTQEKEGPNSSESWSNFRPERSDTISINCCFNIKLQVSEVHWSFYTDILTRKLIITL
jgi:hypothetical protein